MAEIETKLIIFDLDGTLVVNSEFYREVYSGTLYELVAERRGEYGLETLRYCRDNYRGKGELALMALNIPFAEWAEQLVATSLDLITPQPELVERMQKLDALKVVYTGSPTEMAVRILSRLGFARRDFDDIVGWKEPELFPTKWSRSPLPFEVILRKFCVTPWRAWAVGDDWETDLLPARALGIKTAQIENRQGSPDAWFPTLQEFLDDLKGGRNG